MIDEDYQDSFGIIKGYCHFKKFSKDSFGILKVPSDSLPREKYTD